MPHFIRFSALPFGFLVFAGGAIVDVSAQTQTPAQTQPSAQSPAQPIFKAGAEIVRLDVRVTDQDGRPVKDLRREDFEVLEEGRPRPVIFFEHLEEPSGSYAELARRTVESEVSTNQGAARGHLYVLVFDQSHITPGNEQRARRAAEVFLKTRVHPGDRVALFGLPGPGPQIDFTADVSKMTSELTAIRGTLDRLGVGSLGVMRLNEAYEILRGNDRVLTRVAGGLSAAAASTDLPSAVVQRSTGEDPDVFRRLVQEDARTLVSRADQQARQVLLMLSDLVSALRPIEGRKAILYFSEGFYTDHLASELERVAAAAAQSYSVFYSIDLNSREIDPKQLTPVGGDTYSEIHDRISPLGTLATETDGMLINHGSSWLDRALSQIADQSQDYYVLGFEPHPGAVKTRGRYHRVKVIVRRGDVRVGTRTGYATTPDLATPADRRRAINVALSAPFPQQSLRVEYTTYVLRGSSPGMQKVILSLQTDLPIAVAGEKATADVIFAVRDRRTGRVVASGTDSIQLPQASTAGMTSGLGTYRVQFEAPPGEYLMRAVVREPGGLVGSADRHFEVRPLETRDVAASDLVVGAISEGLPVRPAAYTGESLTALLELYGQTPEQLGEVDVVADLAAVGATGALTSAQADLLETKQSGAGVSRGARIDLPLEGVAPGTYLVRATVKAKGETVAQLTREVEVRAGSPPPAPVVRVEPFRPLDLLNGELARRYLTTVREAGGPPALMKAVDLALAGSWGGIEPVLGADPDNSAAHQALKGLAQFAQEKYGEAATELRLAFEQDSHNALLAFFLGWAHRASSDERLAIGAWRSAAVLDPTLVPAHLALAETYLSLSQPALAVQALRAGLAALPQSPELLDRLARLEHR